MIHFDLPKEQSSIIKVIGIGGGGNNAVNHMYSQDIEGVDFIICNTDAQALTSSPIPNKVQLGPHLTQGLGAGANPEIGKQATEESFEEIKKILEVNTKMAFITAGMGGGTGTGGAPIIARICREMGILTVGIVTTPFSYEGRRRMQQADDGIKNLKEYVDTLLVISNDKLRQQFGNLPFKSAFNKADNILATAAKCITDVINIHGIVNVDFADVCTAMRNGGVAILGSAMGEGSDRAQKSIENALASPLLNDSNINGAKWILLNINSAEGEHEHTIDEMDAIQAYVQQQAGDDCDVILGMGHDNTLEKKLSVTIIATGFEQRPIVLQNKKSDTPKEEPKIVMELGKVDEEKKMYNQATMDFAEPDLMAPTLVEPEDEPQHKEPEQPLPPEPVKKTMELKFDMEPSSAEEKQPVEEKKGQQPAMEAPLYSGGYLSRPTHIYSEPSQENKTKTEDTANEYQPMTLVFREEEATPPPPPQEEETEVTGEEEVVPIRVVTIEETEDQKRISAERIARLRNMSFNVKNMETPHELESVPAYIRRNVPLDQPQGSEEVPYSSYTVKKTEDGKQAQISTINTFLDGKKPD